VTLSWRFDGSDALCAVGPGWNDFAQANGGEQCVPAPIGTSLDSIIGDRELSALWAAILSSARSRAGQTLAVGFRCDAPAMRRTVRADILSADGERVEITSQVVAEQARPTVAILDPSIGERAGEAIRICGWCAKVRVDRWVEVEVAVRDLALDDGGRLPPVSHGICEECVIAVTTELGLTPGLPGGVGAARRSVSSTLLPEAARRTS